MQPDGVPSQVDRLVERATRLLGRRLSLVAELPGGSHARTLLVSDGTTDYVARAFPPGDHAADRERQVLPRLAALGTSVPRLVGASDEPGEPPLLLTTRVAGGPPAPTLPLHVVAREMALALAQVHRLPGEGLREVPVEGSPGGVLTHHDFWCGNALWVGDRLTGLVDWSGAAYAPRGVDVAWCRQDLVLLGSAHAAEVFLTVYETASERGVGDVRAWDRRAAEQAAGRVGEWAPNYAGIGRPELTAEVLTERLAAWTDTLLR